MECLLHRLFVIPELAHIIVIFLAREMVLTTKPLRHQFLMPGLDLSFKKFYGHHHDLVNRYKSSGTCMMTDIFVT